MVWHTSVQSVVIYSTNLTVRMMIARTIRSTTPPAADPIIVGFSQDCKIHRTEILYCVKEFKVNFGLLLYLIFLLLQFCKGNEKINPSFSSPPPPHFIAVLRVFKIPFCSEGFASGIYVIKCVYVEASFK